MPRKTKTRHITLLKISRSKVGLFATWFGYPPSMIYVDVPGGTCYNYSKKTAVVSPQAMGERRVTYLFPGKYDPDALLAEMRTWMVFDTTTCKIDLSQVYVVDRKDYLKVPRVDRAKYLTRKRKVICCLSKLPKAMTLEHAPGFVF